MSHEFTQTAGGGKGRGGLFPIIFFCPKPPFLIIFLTCLSFSLFFFRARGVGEPRKEKKGTRMCVWGVISVFRSSVSKSWMSPPLPFPMALELWGFFGPRLSLSPSRNSRDSGKRGPLPAARCPMVVT